MASLKEISALKIQHWWRLRAMKNHFFHIKRRETLSSNGAVFSTRIELNQSTRHLKT
jgi:hypothetical protein